MFFTSCRSWDDNLLWWCCVHILLIGRSLALTILYLLGLIFCMVCVIVWFGLCDLFGVSMHLVRTYVLQYRIRWNSTAFFFSCRPWYIFYNWYTFYRHVTTITKRGRYSTSRSLMTSALELVPHTRIETLIFSQKSIFPAAPRLVAHRTEHFCSLGGRKAKKEKEERD
jgi:hypothetical protein